MKQNREPRNKLTYLFSHLRSQEYTMEKGQPLWKIVLGKLNSHMQKNKTGPILHDTWKLTKNESKALKHKTWNHKTLRRKHRLFDICLGNTFLNLISKDPLVALVVKNLPASVEDIRDMGLIPGSGRSPGEGQGNPLQYSCLENPHRQGRLEGCSS